jgi:hypothetical protein
LTVTVQGQGQVTSSPDGLDCTASCTADFDDGTKVVLSTIPAAGWQFSGWSGGCTGPACALTLTADASATAAFTQLPVVPPPPTIAVSVSPSTSSVLTGSTVRFTATVTGAADQSVSWTVREGTSGGSIDVDGNYVAPAAAGTFHVVAASHADPAKTATATINVTASKPAISVVISPAVLAIPSNSDGRFSATVSDSGDESVTWSVQEGDAGGTIDATGFYFSPQTSGEFHVVATSHADPSVSATALVRTDTPLVDHGGPVLPSPAVYAIWWGSATVFDDAPAQIEQLYRGLNGSPYLRTLDQYMRGAKASVSFVTSLFDPSPASTILVTPGTLGVEICSVLHANGISPRIDGYYAVFVDNNPPSTSSAWHSFAFCDGVQITVAYHLNPEAGAVNQPLDPCGRSQMLGIFGAAATHELAEAMTDTTVNAWKDSLDFQAPEVADRCPLPVFNCSVTLPNGSSWRLEPLWSNAATECVFATP